MTLVWMIGLLLLAGMVAWPLKRRGAATVVGAALAFDLVVAVGALFDGPAGGPATIVFERSWIPEIGASLHLAADGLSLSLMALTSLVGLLALVATRSIGHRPGPFHAALAWCLAGVMGVFCAVDLLLFYLFWELMLIPMFLIVRLWGHEDRARAALKLLVFSQAGSLLLLVAIVGLALEHQAVTGAMSFSLDHLTRLSLAPAVGWPLMLAMVAGFAVKLPVVPLHSWLPDAHGQAPTAGSILLAGLMLKTGAYGLIRFALPIFPDLSRQLAPTALLLGAAGIVLGAWLACAQGDLKRLVAYTSVSHMGFVVVGIYAFHPVALRGAVLQIFCHALSTGGLFLVAGALDDRLDTRRLADMGGLWSRAPRLGLLATVLAMASLGLPGLGNFVAEIFVLFGALDVSPVVAVISALALVLSTIYVARLLHGAFFGEPRGERVVLADTRLPETVALGTAAALLVAMGLYPQPLIERFEGAVAPLTGTSAEMACIEEARP